MKALLIEDDALMRKMISKTIRSRYSDIVFVECENAPEAIAAYDTADTPFDFAIVDFELTQGNGYDVVNHIRGTRQDKLLPLMMCTSRQDRKTVLKMLEIGVNDYLAKPFEPKKAIDKVERLLDRTRKIKDAKHAREQRKRPDIRHDAGEDAVPEEPMSPSAPVEASSAAAKSSPPPAPKKSLPPHAAPTVSSGEEAPRKKSSRHGDMGADIIEDADETAYIDLRHAGDDEGAVEVTDDMFLDGDSGEERL
jgi:CheY-like chemotaxis protein